MYPSLLGCPKASLTSANDLLQTFKEPPISCLFISSLFYSAKNLMMQNPSPVYARFHAVCLYEIQQGCHALNCTSKCCCEKSKGGKTSSKKCQSSVASLKERDLCKKMVISSRDFLYYYICQINCSVHFYVTFRGGEILLKVMTFLIINSIFY